MPPAARITDNHVCPKVEPGPVPHVGGPVVVGSANVIIGFVPAGRVGDMLVCVGPPDTISDGSSDVFINHKKAARIGDPTDHGGKIVTGCPTVNIGTTSQTFTLAGAAASGAPFCEECEKAKKALEEEAKKRAATNPDSISLQEFMALKHEEAEVVGPGKITVAKVEAINRSLYNMVQQGTLQHPHASAERLKLAVEGDTDGQRVPLTYKDRDQFNRFQAELKQLLEKHGIHDATVEQIGSGTTGWKGNPDKFDKYFYKENGTLQGWKKDGAWTPHSDTDFTLYSKSLVKDLKSNNTAVNEHYGIFKNGAHGGRPGFGQTPLGKDLDGFQKKWNQELYGTPKPASGGVEFKVNLDPKPMNNGPTVFKGSAAH